MKVLTHHTSIPMTMSVTRRLITRRVELFVDVFAAPLPVRSDDPLPFDGRVVPHPEQTPHGLAQVDPGVVRPLSTHRLATLGGWAFAAEHVSLIVRIPRPHVAHLGAALLAGQGIPQLDPAAEGAATRQGYERERGVNHPARGCRPSHQPLAGRPHAGHAPRSSPLLRTKPSPQSRFPLSPENPLPPPTMVIFPLHSMSWRSAPLPTQPLQRAARTSTARVLDKQANICILRDDDGRTIG